MSGLPVELRLLDEIDLPLAAGVAARGMRDNPGHIAVFGEDPVRRLRRLGPFFDVLLAWIHAEGEIVCAWHAAELVAVLAIPPQGACFPSLAQQARMAFSLRRGARPRELRRGARWLWEWQRRDPREPHQHVSVVAVDAPLQGRGIGTQLMQDFSACMDRAKTVAYLETDKPENVRLYERFGFETFDETVLYGVPNWFMLRHPTAGRAQALTSQTDVVPHARAEGKRSDQALVSAQTDQADAELARDPLAPLGVTGGFGARVTPFAQAESQCERRPTGPLLVPSRAPPQALATHGNQSATAWLDCRCGRSIQGPRSKDRCAATSRSNDAIRKARSTQRPWPFATRR